MTLKQFTRKMYNTQFKCCNKISSKHIKQQLTEHLQNNKHITRVRNFNIPPSLVDWLKKKPKINEDINTINKRDAMGILKDKNCRSYLCFFFRHMHSKCENDIFCSRKRYSTNFKCFWYSQYSPNTNIRTITKRQPENPLFEN